jgi:hypothetical protein
VGAHGAAVRSRSLRQRAQVRAALLILCSFRAQSAVCFVPRPVCTAAIMCPVADHGHESNLELQQWVAILCGIATCA